MSNTYIDFLNNKGITDAEINKFGLAYYDGQNLYGDVNSNVFNGLVEFFQLLKDRDTETDYDGMVKDSIFIPIQDMYNNIISIAFRRLRQNCKQKFMGINGYKKTLHLYGLNSAYTSILEQDSVFLVEGYWEVIALHKQGIFNVVALCGCSLSDVQIALLKRFTNNFNVLLDPDRAGREGSQKLNLRIQELGGNAKILNLDISLDLDEYLQKFGIERFITLCGEYQINIQRYQS